MLLSRVATFEERQTWRKTHLESNDTFITNIPKIELHVHIDGTMSPELRWKLSQRHGIPLTRGSQNIPITSLDETREAYTRIRGRVGAASASSETDFTFFEAIHGGIALMKDEEDYYDLAIEYYERVSKMNVRYCELFVDPQGHTKRGIQMDVIMGGLRRAQLEAERRLQVSVFCRLMNMLITLL
jgi:adenosine deaminase